MTLVKDDIVNLLGDIQFDMALGNSIGLKMENTLNILDKEDSGFKKIIQEEKMADVFISQIIIFYNYMKYVENRNLMGLDSRIALDSSISSARKFINEYTKYTTFIK